jgi:hypothetical protein
VPESSTSFKREESIVVNLEYAGGKSGNYGVYMKMGYGS